MDLNQLLAGRDAEVKVEWEGEVVQVLYAKNAYTPALEAEVMSDTESGGGRALADLLERLVTDWDITDQDQAYPPTRENIGRLPVAFLVAVMKAVSEAMATDPLLSATSAAPS